jgi:hypothetical protein
MCHTPRHTKNRKDFHVQHITTIHFVPATHRNHSLPERDEVNSLFSKGFEEMFVEDIDLEA